MKDSYFFYKDKLQGEYKTAFDQVEIYVNAQNIDELTCEDRLGSLLDMLLSAQEAGRPVQKVVGSNMEQF
jgi:DNA-binding ferritin-like protein (Dps family)